uniref:Uncharacterized protein n=1 Tax=Strigamia maritima TaxID=126957 RepID=T1J627_STRMM
MVLTSYSRTVHAFGMVVLEILGLKDSGVYTCIGKDSILINEIDALRDELNQLNSDIDQFKARDVKVINELNDMYLDENLIEISFKVSQLKHKLDTFNGKLLKNWFFRHQQMDLTSIASPVTPSIFSSNAKSLFSEVEEERAKGIT